MARLIQRTEHGDEVHELVFQATSIGRGGLNDIVVSDRAVRRLQAEVLSLGRGAYAVRDSHVHGNVLLNGEAVEGQRDLADGDLLRVGSAQFTFKLDPADTAPPEVRAEGRGGGVVRLTVGTLASRVFGYAREVVEMAYFGLSPYFDAYVAAVRMPNLFRDVLGEHAAESAFMPTHKTLVARGGAGEARRLLRSVLSIVTLVSLVLVFAGMVFAPQLMRLMAPGFVQKPAQMATAVSLSRWMMPFLLIIAVASIFGSLLLSDRRFLTYSLAPLASSVCTIAAVVALSGRMGIGCLAVGVVVGGVVQMVICAVPYVRSGETRLSLGTPLVEAGQPALKRVGRASGPIALAGVLGQLRAVVDQILASILFVPGSIGALYQAYRLMQLPFGIFGLAVSREAFPAMIEEATSHGGESFSRAVVRALRLNMFFMVPAMVGLVVLATPFVRLMFERGRFTAEHTELTAVALVCYAVGLVALGEQAVLSRAFYALLNTRTPFYLGALAVIGKVLLSLLLARTPLRHGGLALATSVASWLQAWLLLAMLGRELKRQGRRLTLEGLWSGLAHTTVCGAVMAACTWATLLALQRFVGARGFWGSALCVGVPGLVGLVAYLGTAVVVRCEEARHFRWWRRNVDRTRGSG